MTDELDTLQARLDALKAAYLQRHGLLCMYEHGRPVKADNPDKPIPYRVADLCPLLRAQARAAWQKAQRDPTPIYDDIGWDANGSPVEGAR